MIFLPPFMGRKIKSAINLMEFLVGAFINKRARLLQSLVFFLFLRQTRSDEIFVQFVELNRYLWKLHLS